MCVYMSDKPFDAEACDIGGQDSATNGLSDATNGLTDMKNAPCNRPLKKGCRASHFIASKSKNCSFVRLTHCTLLGITTAKAHFKVLDRVLAAAAALSLKLGLAPVLFAATPRSPSRPSRGRESLRGLAVALRRLRLVVVFVFVSVSSRLLLVFLLF
jgi:hypothetical protein